MSYNRGYGGSRRHRGRRTSFFTPTNSQPTYYGNMSHSTRQLSLEHFGHILTSDTQPPHGHEVQRPVFQRSFRGQSTHLAMPSYEEPTITDGSESAQLAPSWSQQPTHPHSSVPEPSQLLQMHSRGPSGRATREEDPVEFARILQVLLTPHDKSVPCNNCGKTGHQPSQCIKAGVNGFMAKLTCSPCNAYDHTWANCRKRLALPKELRDWFDYKFTFLDRLAKCPQNAGIEWANRIPRNVPPGTVTPYRVTFSQQLFFGRVQEGFETPNWETFNYSGEPLVDAGRLPHDHQAAIDLHNKWNSKADQSQSHPPSQNSATVRQLPQLMANEMDARRHVQSEGLNIKKEDYPHIKEEEGLDVMEEKDEGNADLDKNASTSPAKLCPHSDCIFIFDCTKHCRNCGYPSAHNQVLADTMGYEHQCQWFKRTEVNKDTDLPSISLVCKNNDSHKTMTADHLIRIRDAAFHSIKYEYAKWEADGYIGLNPAIAQRPECQECWDMVYMGLDYSNQALPDL